MNWFTDIFKKKDKVSPEELNKKKAKRQSDLDFIESINRSVKDDKKSRAEQILDSIEDQMRKLIQDKKNHRNNSSEQLRSFEEEIRLIKERNEREVQKIREQKSQQERLFQAQYNEGEKIEHRLLLLWDYWNRECEILRLERKIMSGVLPSEREVINERIKELNAVNITYEQGFKERKIDAGIVKKLKEKLGTWDGIEEVEETNDEQ